MQINIETNISESVPGETIGFKISLDGVASACISGPRNVPPRKDGQLFRYDQANF